MNFFIQYSKEFKYNLSLALPVVLGLLGHTLVQLIDNIMVGQLGATELAAVSLGNSFFFIGMSLGIGFSTAITPLVAESDSLKKNSRLKQIFYHGLFLCSILGVIMSIAIYFSRFLMFDMGQPDDVVYLSFPYLKWTSISLFPLILFQGFKQFSDGLSFTKPAMYATLFSNAINIVLNYFLIFGIWIFPKMGVEGAAIGTLVARVFMLLYLVFYFIKTPMFNKYFDDYKKTILEFNLISKIIKLGTPSALQMLFEVGFFTAAIWLSGFLGKVSQAANQIALNLSTISYMVAMGLSVTAMIRVGNQFGKLNIKELKRIAYSIFILIFLFDIIFCLIFLIFNDSLPWIYLDSGNEISINDTLQVIKLASTLLIISAIFQVSDGVQVVVLGSLKGIQDVNIPTAITFFSYWIIGFPISYYLGLKTSLGSIGIWIGLLAGLTVSAILLLARFNYKLKELLKR